MRQAAEETDTLNIRHQHFQLYYKGLPVEGATYSLHSRKNQLRSANGQIVEGLNFDVSKSTSEQRALAIALADQKLLETSFKGKLPKGELKIARLKQESVPGSFQLCYVFDIRKDQLELLKGADAEPMRLYLDAETGTIVLRESLVRRCFHADPSKTGTYFGQVKPKQEAEPSVSDPTPVAPMIAGSFSPRWSRYGLGRFLDVQANNPNSVATLIGRDGAHQTKEDVLGTGGFGGNPSVTNPNTSWGTNRRNATTAHWLTQSVHDYFLFTFQGQNGLDRQGRYPNVLVNRSPNGVPEVTAFWVPGGELHFGYAPTSPSNFNADVSKTLVTADILGHEYMHGVTFNRLRGDIVYRQEAGAINESLSDIFGTAFERSLFPNNWNWDLGEDAYQIRDLANPTRAFPPIQGAQPQIYEGPNWQNINNPDDFGGVHTNSGVMNKWFHTLCIGNGPNQTITPIEFDQAIQITYRAFRYYFPTNVTYPQARDLTVLAAGDLFQGCSPQEKAVVAAWGAVGLASPNRCSPECDLDPPLVSGNTSPNCNQTVTLTATCVGNGDACSSLQYTARDQFGTAITANGQGNTLNIPMPPQAGTYNITVGATSYRGTCFEQKRSVSFNVSCGQPTTCSLPTNACYTINIDQTGKRLQAIANNSVQQQNTSNANNQIWKLDDRGNGQVSFTSQDGTNQVIKANATPADGVGISLGGYTGTNQHWALECNPAATSQWRVYSTATNSTWDLEGAASGPNLQIYGNRGESFFTYRSFRFETATCPSGGGSCNFALTASANTTNPTCGQAVTLQSNCLGSDCGGVSYSWSGNGISGNGSSVAFNVPNANGSYPYTVTASKAGCGNQVAAVTLNVSGCGGADPCAAYTVGTQVGYRSPATGDPSVKVVVSDASGCKRAMWSNGDGAVNRDWLDYITANPGFSISQMATCLKFSDEPCGGRRAVAEPNNDPKALTLMVSPNPNTGQFTVRFQTIAGQPATLRLSDVSGRAVRPAQTIAGTGQVHQEAITLPAQIRGLLLLEVVSGGQRGTQKVLIE